MAGWVGQVFHLIDPLLSALEKDVMASSKLHSDDTTVPVLEPGRGKTKTGRLWTYVRDDRPCGGKAPPAVLYKYSPDRKGLHPRKHLENFTGILQADAYSGYNKIYQPDKKGNIRVLEASCRVHARRKFHEVHVAGPSPIAGAALRWIGSLYDIEREIRGMTPQKRQEIRQNRAGPILKNFQLWLEQQKAQLPGKVRLAGALRYALSRWTQLSRYLGDGTIEIDNNAAERAMRSVVLGRKNYLFAGSDEGGKRAAAIYSLIETAKLNDINPEKYLKDMLSRIADYPVNKVSDLLPWNWKKNQT